MAGPCANGIPVNNPRANALLVQDCNVLLAARDILAGRARLNWAAETLITEWEGVTVDGSPLRVVEIRFESGPLSGRIPPELGRLSGLEALVFRINGLRGFVPPELGALSELRELDLHGNRLRGPIPPELADLTKLERLDLHANDLVGYIPPELGRMLSLKQLTLSGNRFVGPIPPQLAELRNLEWLQLSQNRLTGAIPPELAELSRLETLSLASNALTGTIPRQLGRLERLLTLNLQYNQLTGEIPEELANLSELSLLYLNGNRLTGEIPTWLAYLSELDSIVLAENQLTGPIPEELAALGKLRTLYLFDNDLSGPIPKALGWLDRMADLRLNGNRLTGHIPAELAYLRELVALDLSNNLLTGIVPPGLADLSKLEELDVSENRLTGCVPWSMVHTPGVRFLSHDGLWTCSRYTPTVKEGHDLSIEKSVLSDRDSVAAAGPLRVTGVGDAVNGSVRLDGTTVVYHHDGSETTGGSFVYVARDATAPQTLMVMVTVTPVNDVPVAADDAAKVDEGGTIRVDASSLLRNDADADNEVLMVARVDAAVNGRVWLDGTTVVYEHDGSETTLGSFTYTASDGAASDTATVTVTVTPVNDAPVAVADTVKVDEGGTVSVDVSSLLINDGDAENDALIFAGLGDAVNGSVRLDGTTVVYEHDGSETTVGSFAYMVSDGAATGTGMVTVAVTPVNDAPVAVADTVKVDEDGTVSIDASSLLSNDTDPDDELMITAVDGAVNGSVRLEGTTVIYRHDGSETSDDRFAYTVSDGAVADTAMVMVTVTPVNDAPVAVGDTATVDEGGTVRIDASSLLRNDGDAENDPLVVTGVGEAVNGGVRLEGTTVVYEHDGSETTDGSFVYTVSDGAAVGTGIVTVAVTPVNDAPVAVGDTATVDEGGTVRVDASSLLRNDGDAENEVLMVARVDGAVNGRVWLDGTTVVYEHDGSETTAGSFAYTVSDGAATDTAMVTVAVTPVNDAPVAVGDTATVDEGGTVRVDASSLLRNDGDPDNEVLMVARVDGAANGRVWLDGTTVVYEHDGSETTDDSFAYTVSDGVAVGTGIVTVAVTPVNDAPVAVGDTATVDEGGTVRVDASSLLRNDGDAENEVLMVARVDGAVNGRVWLDGTTVVYEHDGSETTDGSFAYTVSDGVAVGTGIVTVAVTPVNDAPVAVGDTATVDEGGTVRVDASSLLRNDGDADNDPLVVTGVGEAVNGSVRLEGTTVVYEHDGSETTDGGFAYTVSDGAAMDTAIVTVDVTPVNDLPIGLIFALTLGAGLLAVAALLGLRVTRPRTAS